MGRKEAKANSAAQMAQAKQWLKVANQLAEQLGADIVVFNADIDRASFRMLADACHSRRRRENVVMIMRTLGGDPAAAYWIGRTLQDRYEHFTLFVPELCKSAGTLVALAADELVISDLGELGPLDIQKSKTDDLFDSESGLTVNAALDTLRTHVWFAFEQYFLQIEGSSGGAISVRTAADIAAKLATGVLAPLYSKIDPSHVGESARDMQIATEYGLRLIQVSKAASEDALTQLVSGYPTHGFVIDRAEAEGLFNSVRAPSEVERELEGHLKPFLADTEHTVVAYVSDQPPAQEVADAGPTLALDDRDTDAQEFGTDGDQDNSEEHSADRVAPAETGNGEPGQGAPHPGDEGIAEVRVGGETPPVGDLAGLPAGDLGEKEVAPPPVVN